MANPRPDEMRFEVGGFEPLTKVRTIWRSIETGTSACQCYDFRNKIPDSLNGYRWASYPIIDSSDYHWHVCARFVEFIADRTDPDPLNWTITQIQAYRTTKILSYLGPDITPPDFEFSDFGFVGSGCTLTDGYCCYIPNADHGIGTWWFMPNPVGSADQSDFAQSLSDIEGASGITVPDLARWRLWISMTGGFSYDGMTGDRVYETDETLSSPEVMAFCWSLICPPFCAPVGITVTFGDSTTCNPITWSTNLDNTCSSSSCVVGDETTYFTAFLYYDGTWHIVSTLVVASVAIWTDQVYDITEYLDCTSNEKTYDTGGGTFVTIIKS